jgi:sulfide:quinone oxidoreductase
MADNVLILGGGFAGLEAAIQSSKAGFEVTLVCERDFAYIYPISIWIPTREIEFNDACLPLADVARRHGFKIIINPVSNVDAPNRQVILANDASLSYDYLIIAMGAGKMRPKGVEHTSSICGHPQNVLPIRDRLDELIARGTGNIAVGFGGNPKDPSAVRGGPAFEFVFNLHHLLKKKGLLDRFNLTMFAPMPQPGIRLGEKAYNMMLSWFDGFGIERRFGKKIKEFTEEAVIFEDDSTLPADLIMFIAAGRGHKILMDSGLPQNEAGFLLINDHCQVEGYENVFAIGDSAALQGPKWRAKQGHLAEVMARVAASNIKSISQGQRPVAGYEKHVSILCVMDFGNGAAYVHRDAKSSTVRPLPVVGHWLKKAWGSYWKLNKMGKCPHLPGT